MSISAYIISAIKNNQIIAIAHATLVNMKLIIITPPDFQRDSVKNKKEIDSYKAIYPY